MDSVPQTIGGFRIERKLGQGGMGQVYLARQESLDRQVAVKTLLPDLAQDAEFLLRFLREARAAALFQHPNVVSVIDAGHDEASGLHFIAFEYLAEGSVESLLRERGALTEADALRITAGVLQALAFAEAKGIVHRDVKPDNILLGVGGLPKLGDLGLAKVTDDGAGLTKTGALMGTPLYIAPEQALGDPVDVRADLYSVGLCLWHMLVGRVPFRTEGDGALQIINKHIHRDLPDVRDAAPHVSEATAYLIAWLSARDRDERYPTALAAAQDAARVQAGQPLLGPKAAAGAPVDSQLRRQLAGAQDELADTAAGSASEAATVPPRPPGGLAETLALPPPSRRAIPVGVIAGFMVAAVAIGAGVAIAVGDPPPSDGAADADLLPALDGFVSGPLDDPPGQDPPPPPPPPDPAGERERLNALGAAVAAVRRTALTDVAAARRDSQALYDEHSPDRFVNGETVAHLHLAVEVALDVLEGPAPKRKAGRERLTELAAYRPSGAAGEVYLPQVHGWKQLIEFGDAMGELSKLPVGERLEAYKQLVRDRGRQVFGDYMGRYEATEQTSLVARLDDLLDEPELNPLATGVLFVLLTTAADTWWELSPRERAQPLKVHRAHDRLTRGALGRLLADDLTAAGEIVSALSKGDEDVSQSLIAKLYGFELASDGQPCAFVRARLLQRELVAGAVEVKGRGLLVHLPRRPRRRETFSFKVGELELTVSRSGIQGGGEEVEPERWGDEPVIFVEALHQRVGFGIGRVTEAGLETEGAVAPAPSVEGHEADLRLDYPGQKALKAIRVLPHMGHRPDRLTRRRRRRR